MKKDIYIIIIPILAILTLALLFFAPIFLKNISKISYINGSNGFSGNKKVFADYVHLKAVGNNYFVGKADFVYIQEIAYQENNNLCVHKDFTSNAEDLIGNYKAKVIEYTSPFQFKQTEIGCGGH